jgi:hypothetical protein
LKGSLEIGESIGQRLQTEKASREVGIRCVTGDPRSEALRRLEGRSPNIRGTFSECGDERGSVLEHGCEILSIHPEAVSGTLAVRMQRQEGRTS